MDYQRGEHTYRDGVNEQEARGQFNGMLYSHQRSARSHSHMPYSSAAMPLEHQRIAHSGSMLSYPTGNQFSHFSSSLSQGAFQLQHHGEPAGSHRHLQHLAASSNPRPGYSSQQATSVMHGKTFTSSPGQLPTSINGIFNGPSGGRRPILQPSVAQNQPAPLKRTQAFSASSTPHTQSVPSFSWQPISVHHPVDTHALSLETVQALANQTATGNSFACPGSSISWLQAGHQGSLSSLLNPHVGRPNVSANGRATASPGSPVNDFKRLPLSPFRPLPTPRQNGGMTPLSSVSPSPTTTGLLYPPSPKGTSSCTTPPSQHPSPAPLSYRPSSSHPDPAPIVRPRLGPAERQIKKRTTDNGFNEAIQAFCDNQDEEIKRIASEWKTSLLYVKKRVRAHRRLRENRKPSLYNALMHKKAQEDHLAGQSVPGTLKERHAAMVEDQDIQDILNDPDGEEAVQAIADMHAFQQAKATGIRSSSKVIDNDVVKTWGDLAQRAQNLSKRTNAATFGFVCSSKVGQNVTRQFFGNGPIEGFLLSKFKMSGAEFVEAAEAYFIYTSSGRTASGMGVKSMQKEASKIIVQGLRDVTGNPKLNMEYDHYEYLIVYEYGVQLMGWPSGVEVVSPHKLTAPDAIKVYQAVESRTCQWRKVDGVQLHQIKKSIDARIKFKELVLPERHQQGKKRSAPNQGGGRATKRKRLSTASGDRSKKSKSKQSKKSTFKRKRRPTDSEEEDLEVGSDNMEEDDDGDSDSDGDNGNGNDNDSNGDNNGNGNDSDDDGTDEAPKAGSKTKRRPSGLSSLKSKRPRVIPTNDDDNSDDSGGFGGSDKEVEKDQEEDSEVDELDQDL
ncbi:hypothetical protein F5878DRAFT_666772 [Lentinula raphanica]|uniref:Uncharacterized protein n=1 Tax=Lentinula raphanica TaxID=153919 RepID=A0AA38NX29_9AGAR|nr:hypothetical protein F5878DRAFT_666772 [Lentinula raphanica]